MTDLPPGRELDALVATKVMGWKSTGMREVHVTDEAPWVDADQCEQWCPPNYSTDIAAAWLVVEKLESQGFMFCVAKGSIGTVGIDVRWASFGKCGYEITISSSDSIPHAICLAALKAVEGK